MDTTELRTLLVPIFSDLSEGIARIDFFVVFLGLLAAYGLLQMVGTLFASLLEEDRVHVRRRDKVEEGASSPQGASAGGSDTRIPTAITSLLSRGNYFSKLSPSDIPQELSANLFETPEGQRVLTVECRERFPYGLRALYDALLWTTFSLVIGTGVVWLVSLTAPQEYVLGVALGTVACIWALMVGRALLVTERLCFVFADRRVHFNGIWSQRIEQCLTPLHMTVTHGRKGWRSRVWYSAYELGVSPYFPSREAAEVYFEAFVNACNWELGKLVVSFNGFEITCGKSGVPAEFEEPAACEEEATTEQAA